MTQSLNLESLSVSREVLDAAAAFAKKELSHVDASHDWSHIQRVERLAAELLRHTFPQAPELLQESLGHLVSLCALLHDVDDWKYCSMQTDGESRAVEFLRSHQVDTAVISVVSFVLSRIGFKESLRSADNPNMDECCGSEAAVTVLKIVQDADRLDALGAVGIARCFTFGGAFRRTLYDPETHPRNSGELTREAYMKNGKNSTTINHFHEKLLKLQDLMNTGAGRRLAKQRTEFMIQYLDRFKQEWDALDLESLSR